MSVVLQAKTLQVTPERRTWKFEALSGKGEVPSVLIYREALEVDGSGNITARDLLPIVPRSFADIADDTVTVAGVAYSVSLVAAIITAFADKYGEEDFAAAEAARQEAEPV